jgi:hypothetical protein
MPDVVGIAENPTPSVSLTISMQLSAHWPDGSRRRVDAAPHHGDPNPSRGMAGFPTDATAMHSRGRDARVSHGSPPKEDAGNAGCAVRTRSLVRKSRKRTSSHHRSHRSTGIPCAMVLRFPSCSPRRPGFVVSVVGATRKHYRQLDISVGTSGPHDFSVRFVIARQSMPRRPSHPAPNVRDDRETPSCGPGTREEVPVICPTSQAKLCATD